MLTGKPVCKFVNSEEHEKQDPEGQDVVAGLIREGVQRSSVALNTAPITGDKICGGDEQKQREDDKLRSIYPTENRVELLESFVRVPGFKTDIEHAGLIDAAFALVTNAFKNGKIFFSEGTLPHRRFDRIEKFEDLGFRNRRI